MVRYARVFQSGNSQAVRLPKEFRLEVERVEVSREGDSIVLRPVAESREPWAGLRGAVGRGVSVDFLAEGRGQGEQQRPGLDDLFE